MAYSSADLSFIWLIAESMIGAGRGAEEGPCESRGCPHPCQCNGDGAYSSSSEGGGVIPVAVECLTGLSWKQFICYHVWPCKCTIQVSSLGVGTYSCRHM